MAAQFIFISACCRRGLWLCTKPAMSSLPVPVSPWMMTVQFVAATTSAWLSTSFNLRLSAIISCSPRPREARWGVNRSGAFVVTHVSILPRFRYVKFFRELIIFGSLLLPQIDSRTKHSKQSLIVERLAEKCHGALCQCGSSYLVVGMSRYEYNRDRAVHLS